MDFVWQNSSIFDLAINRRGNSNNNKRKHQSIHHAHKMISRFIDVWQSIRNHTCSQSDYLCVCIVYTVYILTNENASHFKLECESSTFCDYWNDDDFAISKWHFVILLLLLFLFSFYTLPPPHTFFPFSFQQIETVLVWFQSAIFIN